MTTHIGKKPGTSSAPSDVTDAVPSADTRGGGHAHTIMRHRRNGCGIATNCVRIVIVNTTTDAGTQGRTSPRDDSPGTRLAELSATLLGGRGPGASDEEVTDHTRNRPWLGAVPAPVERALLSGRPNT